MAGIFDSILGTLGGSERATAENPKVLPGGVSNIWQLFAGAPQAQPDTPFPGGHPSNVSTTADAAEVGAAAGKGKQSFWGSSAGNTLQSLFGTLALGGLGAGIGAIASPGARGLGAARGFGIGADTGVNQDIALRKSAAQAPANLMDEQLKENQQAISQLQTVPNDIRTYNFLAASDPKFKEMFPTQTDYLLYAKAPNDLRTQISTAGATGKSPIPNQDQYMGFQKQLAGSKAQPNDIMKSYGAVYGEPKPGELYDKDKMINLAGALAQAKRPDLSNDDQKVIAGSMTMNQIADEAKKELLAMDPKLLGRVGGNIDKAAQWAGLNDPEQADHFRKFLAYRTALADEGSYTFLHRGSLQAAQYFQKALPDVINTPREIISNVDAVKKEFGILAQSQLATAEFKKQPFENVLQSFYGGPGGAFQVPSVGAKGQINPSSNQQSSPSDITPAQRMNMDSWARSHISDTSINAKSGTPNNVLAQQILKAHGGQ